MTNWRIERSFTESPGSFILRRVVSHSSANSKLVSFGPVGLDIWDPRK